MSIYEKQNKEDEVINFFISKYREAEFYFETHKWLK
jgi:hypothetical protein